MADTNKKRKKKIWARIWNSAPPNKPRNQISALYDFFFTISHILATILEMAADFDNFDNFRFTKKTKKKTIDFFPNYLPSFIKIGPHISENSFGQVHTQTEEEVGTSADCDCKQVTRKSLPVRHVVRHVKICQEIKFRWNPTKLKF